MEIQPKNSKKSPSLECLTASLAAATMFAVGAAAQLAEQGQHPGEKLGLSGDSAAHFDSAVVRTRNTLPYTAGTLLSVFAFGAGLRAFVERKPKAEKRSDDK